MSSTAALLWECDVLLPLVFWGKPHSYVQEVHSQKTPPQPTMSLVQWKQKQSCCITKWCSTQTVFCRSCNRNEDSELMEQLWYRQRSDDEAHLVNTFWRKKEQTSALAETSADGCRHIPWVTKKIVKQSWVTIIT